MWVGPERRRGFVACGADYTESEYMTRRFFTGVEASHHLPKVSCPRCLVSLDILLGFDFAKIVEFNNGVQVEIQERMFPVVDPEPGFLFGIDAATYELWRGTTVRSPFVLTNWIETTRELLARDMYPRERVTPIMTPWMRRYVTNVNGGARSITITAEAADPRHAALTADIEVPRRRTSRVPKFIRDRTQRLDGR